MKLGMVGAHAPFLGLGIDPGPTRSGVALLSSADGARFHVELGMHALSADRWLRSVILEAVRRRAIVGVETLFGYAYEAKRVQALVETARVEGRLLEAVEAAGGIPEPIPARDWRGELCGSSTASNAQIRIVVEGVCVSLPALRAESREHVYDAIGVGIVALMRARRIDLKLPPEVRLALFRQQAADSADRAMWSAAGKARKAAGLPPPGSGRSPTRAQTKRRSEAATKAWAGKTRRA